MDIEILLKYAGEYGLSIRQLKNKTGLSKNNIKRLLFQSKNVKDCNPLVHGSCKRKINVYSFQPFEISYIKRKKFKQNNLNKVNFEPFEQEIEKFDDEFEKFEQEFVEINV